MYVHPWDLSLVKQKKYQELKPKHFKSAQMVRNWYELSIPELENKKLRMRNWFFKTGDADVDHKKMWIAFDEVCDVLKIKKKAEADSFVQLLINTLCL